MTTYEQHDVHAIRALQEVLAGRVPSEGDTNMLTGDVKACLDALIDALQGDAGVQGARKAFLALAKDRPWLVTLASLSPAGEQTKSEAEPPTRRIRFFP